jgi:glycosyltransferase involved in cell wall biosynthesis
MGRLGTGYSAMIYIVLPVGSFHGWGVCGKYITKELSRLDEVILVSPDFTYNDIYDEFDFRLLKSKMIRDDEKATFHGSSNTVKDHPILQATNKTLKPMIPHLRGSLNVGYTFFEDTVLDRSALENGSLFFDTITTGSTWCESILRNYNLTNVKTVIQGIDPTIFNPSHSEKEYLRDSFVVFSGGKFEFRKGQDIVIRAFKHLQDKYRDVYLINSWFNSWPFSFNTMSMSPHITFSPPSGDYLSIMNKVLADNGINPDKVITLPLYPNIMMPRIYKNTDIGLFPNRCEGGTNLVLMEYMGCGKPVLASYNSGHKDILTGKNSLMLTEMKHVPVTAGDQVTAVWDEPSLDETVEKLEFAYHNRNALKDLARQAGEDLSRMTWKQTAQNFHNILKPGIKS